MPSRALSLTKLKYVIVRPMHMSTSFAMTAGGCKMVWRRLKLMEDSTVWLLKKKNQGSK